MLRNYRNTVSLSLQSATDDDIAETVLHYRQCPPSDGMGGRSKEANEADLRQFERTQDERSISCK